MFRIRIRNTGGLLDPDPDPGGKKAELKQVPVPQEKTELEECFMYNIFYCRPLFLKICFNTFLEFFQIILENFPCLILYLSPGETWIGSQNNVPSVSACTHLLVITIYWHFLLKN